MKNVLIIGATGQIGTELTMKLRNEYPNGQIVAGYIPGAEPKGILAESGPSEVVDITNPQQIADAVDKYKVDTIYNLAALLSATAEAKPQLAYKIGLGGLYLSGLDKALCVSMGTGTALVNATAGQEMVYLGGTGVAEWTKPRGGYFVGLYVMRGCAKRTYQLCREAGVCITEVRTMKELGRACAIAVGTAAAATVAK